MWWLHVLEVASSIAMYWLAVGLLKHPRYETGNRPAPRRNVPTCKQTSEVNR